MSIRKLYRPSWAAWLSLIIHLIWIVIALYTWAVTVWAAPRDWVYQPRGMNDSIRTAAEMGRLEMVSLSLAILGVTLAVAAVGGFFVVRAAAMDAAREEAGEMIKVRLPDLVTAEMIGAAIRSRPEIAIQVAQVLERNAKPDDISEQDADSIAAAELDGVANNG